MYKAYRTANDGPERPFLIGMVAILMIGQAFLCPAFFLIFLSMTPDGVDLESLGSQSFEQFKSDMIWMSVKWFFIAGILGPLLWMGKPMARHLLFSLCVLPLLIEVVRIRQWAGVIPVLIAALVVGGYLYRKSNVRLFFQPRTGLDGNGGGEQLSQATD